MVLKVLKRNNKEIIFTKGNQLVLIRGSFGEEKYYEFNLRAIKETAKRNDVKDFLSVIPRDLGECMYKYMNENMKELIQDVILG